MTDRLAPGYQPRFDLDYKVGHQAELWIDDLVKALGTEKVEVKYDAQFAKTGNVYVEFRCLRKGFEWLPSGIATTDAEYWVFVMHSGVSCVVVRTDELKLAARRLWKPGNVVSCDKGSHPTKGVKIPLIWLLQHGTKMENAS